MVAGGVVNANEVLEGHVALRLDCPDRIYLNAYLPRLQTSGQVASFMTDHLGLPFPSGAVFEQISNRFRNQVRAFAKENGIAVLGLASPDRRRWDDRKLDHVQGYLARAERRQRAGGGGHSGCSRVGVGVDSQREQERGEVPLAVRQGPPPMHRLLLLHLGPCLRARVHQDHLFLPYPAKAWLNGHEWLKRQATKAGLVFEPLANGFAACDRPRCLQVWPSGSGRVTSSRGSTGGSIPSRPFGRADQRAGYWWELSVRQVEVATTVVLDDPRRARGSFEALVADNIDIGRPASVSMVFNRHVSGRTPGLFRGRIFTAGTEVNMDFTYKHCRVKQYLKLGRAIRIETVVNDTRDFEIGRRLAHLPEVFATLRQVNARLLMIERAGQACGLETAIFERISQPYTREGSRTGALRFGDPRVTALAGALCAHVHTVSGFTNKSLRSLVAGLLGADYTTNQMSYDLRRLRLHRLIERQPRTNTCTLTPRRHPLRHLLHQSSPAHPQPPHRRRPPARPR